MAGVAQIVAEELGVPIEQIRMVWGDTDATPFDAGAQGSRTLFNAGNAALRAARQVRQELIRRAADSSKRPRPTWNSATARSSCAAFPTAASPISTLMAGQMWVERTDPRARHLPCGRRPDYDPATLQGSLVPAFNAPDLPLPRGRGRGRSRDGFARVIDFVVAQDVGFAINPTYVEGQMQGGAVQGIGYALTEELVLENGRILNPNLALYKLPTTLERRTSGPSSSSTHPAKDRTAPRVSASHPWWLHLARSPMPSPTRSVSRSDPLPLKPELVLRAIRDGERAGAAEGAVGAETARR